MKRLECVYLIDDNDDENYLHKRALEKSNIVDHVKIFLNAKDALDSLQSVESENYIKPDLIFLDINMPIMNGFEFLDEYAKLDKKIRADNLMVLLTTSLNPNDKTRVEKNGYVTGYANKLLTEEVIQGIVQKHF